MVDLDSSQCNFSFFLSLIPSSNETQNANPSTKTHGQGQWHPLCQAELSACPWFALTVCTYHITSFTHGWPKIPDRNTLKLGGLIWLVASESWVVHHGEESRTGHVTAGAHDRILHLAFHTGSRHNTGQSQRWLSPPKAYTYSSTSTLSPTSHGFHKFSNHVIRKCPNSWVYRGHFPFTT